MAKELKTFKFEETEIELMICCLNEHISEIDETFNATEMRDGLTKTRYDRAKRLIGYFRDACRV